jgi:hypothetical protein
MQSFPLDYLPDRGVPPGLSAAAVGNNGRLALYHNSSGPPPAPRHISTGRLGGPSHAHCANCGSGQALPAHHSHHHHHHQRQQRAAPDVPKRTVSRLTSLDVGESSELYPARSTAGSGEQLQLLQLAGRHSEQQSRAGSNQSSPRSDTQYIPLLTGNRVWLHTFCAFGLVLESVPKY